MTVSFWALQYRHREFGHPRWVGLGSVMLSLTLICALTLATTPVFGGDSPAEMLTGSYNNQAQIDTAPAGLSRVPARSGEWLDFQAADFLPLEHTSLEGEVIYLQWRDAQDDISRQRIWVFETVDAETVEMTFYAMREPTQWTDLHTDQGRQAALQQDDLVSYPEGCILVFRRIPSGWAGALNPSTCSIVTQRSGRNMSLEAWIVITDKQVWYRERGLWPDGTFAFVVPGIGSYEFDRP